MTNVLNKRNREESDCNLHKTYLISSKGSTFKNQYNIGSVSGKIRRIVRINSSGSQQETPNNSLSVIDSIRKFTRTISLDLNSIFENVKRKAINGNRINRLYSSLIDINKYLLAPEMNYIQTISETNRSNSSYESIEGNILKVPDNKSIDAR